MHKHCFYRRLKKEVLKDLPDKIRNVRKVDITNRDEYNKAEQNFIAYLRENLGKTQGEINTALRGQFMVQMGILKKVAARGKKDAMLDYMKEITDAGEKVIVFAWHVDIVSDLKAALPRALTIVGSDSDETRNRNIELFQNNPHYPEIICNIKSGGVGITLTAASRVGFIELPWNPANCEQCEDRAHRIGQKDSVSADYFLGAGTIDEYIWKIIAEKWNIVNEAMGINDMEKVQTNIVDDIINLFTKDKGIEF